MMITNLIEYLYNIKVDMIRKHNNNYIFYYNDKFYIFKETDTDLKYISFINYFIKTYNTSFHTPIENKNKELISIYNNKKYILMMINFNTNRRVLINDIKANNYHISYTDIKHFNWLNLWKKKIDQVEYYLSNRNDLDINTLSIINYYLSLGELSINYLNKIKDEYISLTLCHKRIEKDIDLYSYYCIDNLIIDNINRDIGEYIKNYIYNNKKIDIDILNNIYGIDNINLLISRILFPSFFFDIFDSYVLNNKSFDDFENNFKDKYIYESNLNLLMKLCLKCYNIMKTEYW